MELLVFPTKISNFVAAVLQCRGVKEVKLETLGRDEACLISTLLYVIYITVCLLENASYQIHTKSLGNESHNQWSGGLSLGCKLYLSHLRGQDCLLWTGEKSRREGLKRVK